MGYVHADSPDIFVSYPRALNRPPPDSGTTAAVGWVTRFVEWLEHYLRTELGGEEFHVWMDHQLEANAELTPRLHELIESCAVFLVILSEAYLRSDWCKDELTTFVAGDIVRRKRTRSRIFIIETTEIAEPPPELSPEILRTRFWYEHPRDHKPRTMGLPVPTREHEDFQELIIRLSRDIAEELKEQRAEELEERPKPPVPGGATGRPAVPGAGPAIYLAESSDDLSDLRYELKTFLTQAGYRVLPRALNDPSAFEDAVRTDLGQSILFVQLLGASPGRRLDEDADRRHRVAVQHELAVACNVPVLQWRSRDLARDTIERVSDPRHRALLDGPEVMALDIQELKVTVQDRIRKILKPPAPPPEEGSLVVVIDAKPDLVSQFLDELESRSICCLVLPRGPDSKAHREAMKVSLEDSHALMLAFGDTDPTAAYCHLINSKKVLDEVPKGPRVLSVYEGPPPKDDRWMGIRKLPNLHLHTIRCHNGPDPAEIDRFVAFLRERSQA